LAVTTFSFLIGKNFQNFYVPIFDPSFSPTTLDIVLAAHILLLLNPPFPDPFLQTLVSDSYPTLSSHARRVYVQALSSGSPARSPPPSFSWGSLLPWPSTTKKQVKKSAEDVHYDRMRWRFYGLAIGSLAAYLVVVGGMLEVKKNDDEE
jgi:sorting and assembly machinery component 37